MIKRRRRCFALRKEIRVKKKCYEEARRVRFVETMSDRISQHPQTSFSFFEWIYQDNRNAGFLIPHPHISDMTE